LTKLAEWCQQFSPLVGLDQATEPDCLLMDVTGLAHLFGGEEALARAVVVALQERGFVGRVAIADTVSAAWGLARRDDEDTARRPVRATGATEPTGGATGGGLPYTIVTPGDKTALAELPVEALRLPERTTHQLHRLGIRRLGQLQQLSRAGLAARFGEPLVERLDQITGDASEVILAHRPREPLEVGWSFEHATTHHEAIEYVLGELLGRLSQRLVEQGQGVLRLICRLICKDRRPLSIEVNLFQPAVHAQHLLALARMQLALLVLPDAVEEIRVTAASTAPREQPQRELFAGSPRDNPSQLALLVERLSNRLGRQRVVRARLQAEPQPELAYRYFPLTGEPPPTDSQCSPPPPTPGPMFRPLQLFQPPEPIEVVGIALDGPPAMFHYRRQRYRVARWFGPERIETGWWRGPSARRDYYRVETETGSRLWLFRRLQDKRWFLQGKFE
jgi:protein ImuB